MKKFISSSFVVAFAAVAFAANYDAQSLSSTDQSYDGRVIAKYFSYNSGTVAHTNDTIALAFIPENAMIIRGEVSVSAMGGGQSFDMGLRGADGSGYYTGTTVNDVDLFLDGIASTNAVKDSFACLQLGDANAPFELGGRPVYLTITAPVSTPLWPTNVTITGFVLYIEP